MLRNDTDVDTFTGLVRRLEPGLRRALTAAFGSEVGREAAAEALAYGWQHWAKVAAMDNPSGYLFRVGQNKADAWWDCLAGGVTTRSRGPNPDLVLRGVPSQSVSVSWWG